MSRKKIIAGNWKMNKTPSEAVELVKTLAPLVQNPDVDVVYCVPAIDIVPVAEAIKGSNVQLGAENMYCEDKGAYTGEISAAMLKDAGVQYVILGHSERRGYFGETSEDINKKMKQAIKYGLTPIMCCGESLEQREQGIHRLGAPADQGRLPGHQCRGCCCYGDRIRADLGDRYRRDCYDRAGTGGLCSMPSVHR